MADFVAQTDLVFNPDLLDYGVDVTTDINLFTYNNLAASYQISFSSPLLDIFSYTTILFVGKVPVTGSVISAEIKNMAGTTTIANITGLNFSAAGNLDKMFVGKDLYPTMFGGNDTFFGNGHVIEVYGDYGTISSSGTRYGGDDTMVDGDGAASGKMIGDANLLGTQLQGQNGGTLHGGKDVFTLTSSNSSAYGDVGLANQGLLFGGDDSFTASATLGTATVAGDAYSVQFSGATVFGGDDVISFGDARTSATDHKLVGDVYDNSGHVVGGNDVINSSIFTDPQSFVYGDVKDNQSAGIVIGGNDTLRGNSTQAVVGDVGVNNSGVVYGGNDIFVATVANDFMVGDVKTNNGTGLVTGGNDTLNGGGFNDTLVGDVDDNKGFLLKGGDDILHGGDDNDWLYGDYRTNTGTIVAGGNDKLYGDNGNDYLFGNSGNDVLYGGDGIDDLTGGEGDDLLDGGNGPDTASYVGASSGVSVSLKITTAQDTHGAGTDTLVSIEGLQGSAFDDWLIGDNSDNQLDGGKGDDALEGGGGPDALIGGDGTDIAIYTGSASQVTVKLYNGTGFGGEAQGDTLLSVENITGSNFNDTLIGANSANGNTLNGIGGNDGLFGLSGDDILRGGGGADMLDGGTGSDTAIYDDSSASVVVKLYNGTGSGGDAQGDTLTKIENITGSDYNDTLIGSYGVVNTLKGGGGNDYLFGLSGNDRLEGGAGDDLLVGGSGADTLVGGLGMDTASYDASTTRVTVKLYAQQGMGGDAHGDTLISVENVIGSSHDDTLIGSYNADNVLTGGKGDDGLFGLTGTDSFIFNKANWGNDTIGDFEDGVEKADMRGSGALAVNIHVVDTGGDAVVDFGGADHITFTGLAGHIDASDFLF